MSYSKQIVRSSFTPIYVQIADLLREKINSGELEPGSQVWSEHDIMSKFEVSRNTAQKAIETLVNDGVVTRKQGKGSFVSQPKVVYGLQDLISFSEETIAKGLKPTSKVLQFTRDHPEPKHADELMISRNDWVYKLERIRFANNCPISHQVSILPERLCPNLDAYDFQNQSLYSVLEEKYNLSLAWKKIIARPIGAGKYYADMFDIPGHTPLLLTDSVTYLVGGTPIESNINIFLSQRYEFTVLSQRGFSSKGVGSI